MTSRQPAQRVNTRPRPSRAKDAAASKQALLAAAQFLFGQRGFERTTIRDIGERAGVDAALIARYFGGKADLYIATVVAESQREQPPSAFERFDDVARAVIKLTDDHGLGPVTQALIRSDTTDDIRAAARSHMDRRLVAPVVTDLTRRGSDRPELRAAIAVSALMGINLARALGWFDPLVSVPTDELVKLVAAMLDGTAPLQSERQGSTQPPHE
jgi:AcrR family transcriptional regulator